MGPKDGSTVPVKTKNVVGVALVTVADVRTALHFDTATVCVYYGELSTL